MRPETRNRLRKPPPPGAGSDRAGEVSGPVVDERALVVRAERNEEAQRARESNLLLPGANNSYVRRRRDEERDRDLEYVFLYPSVTRSYLQKRSRGEGKAEEDRADEGGAKCRLVTEN